MITRVIDVLMFVDSFHPDIGSAGYVRNIGA